MSEVCKQIALETAEYIANEYSSKSLIFRKGRGDVNKQKNGSKRILIRLGARTHDPIPTILDG